MVTQTRDTISVSVDELRILSCANLNCVFSLLHDADILGIDASALILPPSCAIFRKLCWILFADGRGGRWWQRNTVGAFRSELSCGPPARVCLSFLSRRGEL